MTQPAALEDLGWRDDALERVEAFARSGAPFTADEVRDGFREPPKPSMWGPVFQTLAQRGVIHHVGAKKSQHRSRKGGWTGIWKGTSPKLAAVA